MGMDLSYFEALMGGPADEPAGAAGGVWVVSPEGALDDGMLRLLGKARVVADALGSYVYALIGRGGEAVDLQAAIRAGADHVLTARGVPAADDLAAFFRDRAPQAVLLPHTLLGRVLGPALAQALEGGLCGLAADLAVDPIYQRIVAHQPVLDDAARQAVTIIAAPAVAVVATELLPAAFNEPWRSGQVEETGLSWAGSVDYPQIALPAPVMTLKNAPVIVAAGLGMRDAPGFALAGELAQALGGVVAGDVAALDAGWITEAQLVGLTGQSVAPRLYLALGIDGNTDQFMATAGAGCIVAVQPDSGAPFVPVADYNIIADPVEFAQALLQELARA